jgi:hypothetical protein
MADGVINGKLQPKQTKAMNVRLNGYKIKNANNNSESTGNPAIELCQLLDKTSSRSTSLEYAETVSHAAYNSQNVKNRVTKIRSSRSMKKCPQRWHLARV